MMLEPLKITVLPNRSSLPLFVRESGDLEVSEGVTQTHLESSYLLEVFNFSGRNHANEVGIFQEFPMGILSEKQMDWTFEIITWLSSAN